jgi:hypothetical protein
MSALSLLSIALLLAALAGCAVLWTRSGEIRVGLFGALFLLIAIHLAVAPWTNWNDPLGWNLSSSGGLIGLAVGALGVFAVVALWRTLAERDRAEKLHWDSMETLRVINELSEDGSTSLDDKIARLLEMGAARFDLEVAMLARVREDRYEIIAVHSPENFPATSGAVFSLGETFCKNTLNSDRPVGVEQISESNWAGTLNRAAFPFSAYLGTAITVDRVRYGTLSFASFEPRKYRFTGTEKDLIRLMAQWIGSAFGQTNERQTAIESSIDSAIGASIDSAVKASANPPDENPTFVAPAPASSAARQPNAAVSRATELQKKPAARKRPGPRYEERVIDPNRVLQRTESRLRSLLGDSVKLVLKLDPGLGFAAAKNLPLDAIVRSLVINARNAMPKGGELVVETANVEIDAGESNLIPTMAPDRYVKLSFVDSGSDPDADALSKIFDRAPADAAQPSGGGRLALPSVYRILQICGGDLSVEIEPGCGSTYTVYLPRAREQVQPASEATPALAPVTPSATVH